MNKGTAVCFVSARDYELHFQGVRQPPDDPPDVAVWSGEERRTGQERRTRERRGERAGGRRYRLFDRRKPQR